MALIIYLLSNALEQFQELQTQAVKVGLKIYFAKTQFVSWTLVPRNKYKQRNVYNDSL